MRSFTNSLICSPFHFNRCAQINYLPLVRYLQTFFLRETYPSKICLISISQFQVSLRPSRGSLSHPGVTSYSCFASWVGHFTFLSLYLTIGLGWFEIVPVIGYLLSVGWSLEMVVVASLGEQYYYFLRRLWKLAISVPTSSWSPRSTLCGTKGMQYLAVSLCLCLFLLLIPTPSLLNGLKNSRLICGEGQSHSLNPFHKLSCCCLFVCLFVGWLIFAKPNSFR